MKKAVLFDLDGTLLDTSRDIQRVLNASLKKFAVPEISYEQTLRYVGNGAKLLVERAAAGCDREVIKKIYADFSERFPLCDNSLTTLYAGEDEVLRDLKDRGIKMAIVTNKPQKAAENTVEKHLKKYSFDCVIGQTEGCPLKPDPSSTLSVIKRFGLSASECVFVGDGETDVITSANAGVDCISVLWGFRSKDELEAAGAKVFASTYFELKRLILCR